MAPAAPPANPTPYVIKAYHVAEKLRLKDLRERFSAEAVEFSNYEMIVRYSADSYLFVYNYGSVVFFNVAPELQEKELSAIQEYRVPSDQGLATDVFFLEVQESPMPSPGALSSAGFAAGSAAGSGGPKVFFDRVVTPRLSFEIIKIACMLLAESTALEYYEVLIENLLEKTNRYSKKLQEQGRMLESSEDLIKFIGLCLDTKQSIIANLYIVDSPDETWESVELDKLHQELKNMMEVDIRYRALEYKIKIIQESVDVIVDLSKSRREVLLEMTIILLIAFEIVLTLIKWT